MPPFASFSSKLRRLFYGLALGLIVLGGVGVSWGQEERGSIVEDRAARKLLQAGDDRMLADETEKALEIWRSLIERYPRSRVRYEAHMRLGNYLLEQKRVFDEARGHFEIVAEEVNEDVEQRAEATLKTGICFYEGRHYGQCFKILRQVIEDFPNSGHVNRAHYYIGLGHFKLGHYSRAIEALENVGTALSDEDKTLDRVEIGMRLFVRVDDQDLAILEPGETIEVLCKAGSGDEELVECVPIGRQVRVVLGSIPTQLGRAIPGNGKMEVRGGDRVEVTYVDRHTADKQFDRACLQEVEVVSTGLARVKDGSYGDALEGVVIGKQANLQVVDGDHDVSDDADRLGAVAEIWRLKTDVELEEEMANLTAKLAAAGQLPDATDENAEEIEVDRYRMVDQAPVELREIKGEKIEGRGVRDEGGKAEEAGEAGEIDIDGVTDGAGEGEAADFLAEVERDHVNDPTIHSGVFRGTVGILGAEEAVDGDGVLQARVGDLLRLRYVDEVSLSGEVEERVAEATCVAGNLGDVRVTKTDISDAELKIKTRLRTAEALTNIGNHYKEFGLKEKADAKYGEALEVAEEVLGAAQKLGGTILEQAYVQLWRTYFAMEQYNQAVGMSQRLMKEFPESTFVDEAMLQQAHAFRKKSDPGQAIQLYGSILRLNASPLKGEAQFGIAETYEEMAAAAGGDQGTQLYERAFVEYQKVYEQFPDSGRVGDAVAKMANFYYQKQDYHRAIDVFENVLTDYPDANFLDIILFNYGRCLYRLERRAPAREMFDQLINEFPESPVAPEAKRISEALVKAGF